MNDRPTIVVALGGNAISQPGQPDDIPAKFAQTRKTTKLLADAIAAGFRLVITHGNGPQVGNVLRRSEIASHEVYPVPLEICVADTQAGMGYMISQCLMNELAARGKPRPVTTLVTTVSVDRADPAFEHFDKPIGPRLSRAIADEHVQNDDWVVTEVGTGEFRRVVPSPRPQRILEIETIRKLLADDELIVCCGGGGIPVCQEDGVYHGVGAVIDKDLTSALLARELQAETLALLTTVPSAFLNFGTPAATPIGRMTVAEARDYLAQGQFASGSMGPKIEAAVQFVEGRDCPSAFAMVAQLESFMAAAPRRVRYPRLAVGPVDQPA